MSFWNSRVVKARKKHSCIYCQKTISVGEPYSRETGTFEGDFNDYCLCLRCRYILDMRPEDDGYLSDFYEKVDELSLITCPKCGSIRISDYRYSYDRMSCECECEDCGNKFTADLSLESLKNILEKK